MADVMGFLKKAIPWIGAAATGNVPLLVAMAAKAVSDATGGKVKADSDAIAAAVAGATPEQIQALKLADQDFALKMQALNYQTVEDLEKISADDRASARNREIQVRDKTPKIIASVIITATVVVEGYCAYAVFHHQGFSTEGAIIIGRILGMLDTSIGLVLAYYFGSSAGSDRKTEILANGNGTAH